MNAAAANQSVVDDTVVIRAMTEPDLDVVNRIFRTAFGTLLGAPEPESFFGDTDLIGTRWNAAPDSGLAAEVGGQVVGSNFLTAWGSFGFFGPLTVHPDLWNQGIARQLLGTTMDKFAEWQIPHLGLFTFADSPKHIGLYRSFGFWPRYLTAIVSSPVVAPSNVAGYHRFSELALIDRDRAAKALRELTGSVFDGLDCTREIDAVYDQRLGDTVIVDDANGVGAMAVCHTGAGSEAGSGTCYIKFAAVRPGPTAPALFRQLIDSCQDLAADRGTTVLTAGVNLGREQAASALSDYGFRTQMLGVAMHRPNRDGFEGPGVFVLDDWR